MKKITAVIPKGPGRVLEALDSLNENNLPFIVQEGLNTSKNRNIAASKVKTEFTAFINTHTILPKSWEKKVLNFFEAHPEIDILGGPQLTHPNESYTGKVTGYALTSLFGAATSSIRYGGKKTILNANEKHLTSANLICKSPVLKKIKFDESIYPGEDPKFISDAKSQGFKIAYSPDIYVFHRRRNSIKEFAKQNFNYGLTRPKKESFFQSLKHLTFTIPAFFTFYLALFPVLFLIHPILLAPLILYIILSLSFSTHLSIKNSDFKALLLLPFIFFTIHIVYGLGFIYGTLTKNKKTKE